MKLQPEQIARLAPIKRSLVGACPDCQGLGHVYDDDGESEPCHCMVTFRWIMALVVARIPPETWFINPLKDVRSSEEAVETIKRRIQDWTPQAGLDIGLLMVGPNGTGKTTLACELGKWGLSLGEKVGYLTAKEYINATQPSSSTAWLLDWVRGLRVVILDELDKPHVKANSGYVPAEMDGFLRDTILADRRIIGITNADVTELRTRYGNSFVSALQRSCSFLIVSGEDLSEQVQEERERGNRRDYSDPAFRAWARLYHEHTYVREKEL